MATVRIPQSMAEQIDRLRGDVPRDRFVRRMLEKALENPQAKGGIPEGAGGRQPASAPSRASAREADGEQGARTASLRSAPLARQVPAGPQASPPSDGPSVASQGCEGEAGVNGGAGAARTTVEEMLASCPNCAEELQPAELEDQTPVLICPDCGYARKPS
jgi:DNA-directed RNA polymerase subunit RPC12/RpoP